MSEVAEMTEVQAEWARKATTLPGWHWRGWMVGVGPDGGKRVPNNRTQAGDMLDQGYIPYLSNLQTVRAMRDMLGPCFRSDHRIGVWAQADGLGVAVVRMAEEIGGWTRV